ncbi:MAG: caspase family protein [Actinomycetota bacterium]
MTGSALSNCPISQQLPNLTKSASISVRSIFRNTKGYSRKLALLVGINNDPHSSRLSNLKGYLTDVELQRHLLVYCLGFNPKDIITLTDAQATRKNILEAFEKHLIKQAKPDDILVFHYSGHGSKIADLESNFPDGISSTIVPVDSSRPADNISTTTVKDITGKTLFLLMKALPTEQVTVVLDCCYSGGAKRGNLGVRTVRGGTHLQACSEERDYQQKWLSQLNLTPEEFKRQRRGGVARGVFITATNRYQLAADCPFDGFMAGAFIYMLTQYLRQQAGKIAIINALPNIGRSTAQISFTMQEPEADIDSFGLFLPSYDIIVGSFGLAGESVQAAVRRLEAKFKSMLAAKIVKLLLNASSSRLDVKARLRRSGPDKSLISEIYPVQSRERQLTAKTAIEIDNLPLNTPIELQIFNNELCEVYICVLLIDSTGEITVIFPNQWSAAAEAARLASSAKMLIPDVKRDSFKLQTQEPFGMTEVLILASTTPLRKALKALQAIAFRRSQLSGPMQLDAPIEAIESLLEDLAEPRSNSPSAPQRMRQVDIRQLSAMSMTFEVI